MTEEEEQGPPDVALLQKKERETPRRKFIRNNIHKRRGAYHGTTEGVALVQHLDDLRCRHVVNLEVD